MAATGAVPPPVSIPLPTRRLEKDDRDKIAVLWSPVGLNLSRTIQAAIDEVAETAGFSTMRLDLLSDEPEKLEWDLKHFLKRIHEESSVKGVITAFLDLPEADIDALYEKGKPVVCIDRPSALSRKGNVAIYHRYGGTLVARALLEIGRRKVAFVGPINERGWAGGERAEGVRSVLAEAGAEFIPVDEYKYDMEEAAEATAAMFEAGTEPDAMVFASDAQALGGLRVIKERGKKVPEEIAIVGFDDSVPARQADPPLSSVRQPFAELGKRSSEMLVGVLKGTGHLEDILVKEQLVLRGSCLAGYEGEIIYEPGTDVIARIRETR
ncbi:MAG: LacI family transcriptional regulator [Candidatus Hydrogenedentota bacterium]|nr:MAG: LacI family transcriptional regulator [Candidatus Hydrogenedentota bacterium]